jgi:response regulator RpfG family c-di-GMP phosphodiesterase
VLVGLSTVTLGMLFYLYKFLPAQLNRRTRESIGAFSRAVELRFPSHEGLTEAVVELSLRVGSRMDVSSTCMERLELAAMLRDVGLCAIPYKLVNEKPVLRWSDEDKVAYYRHQEISATMLELVPSLKHIAPIVRCHHTNYDGSDGPHFPSHENLPLESRILKVVSAYVWAERWQGRMLARTWIEQGTGVEYDPVVVAAFWEVVSSSRAAGVATERQPVAKGVRA